MYLLSELDGKKVGHFLIRIQKSFNSLTATDSENFVAQRRSITGRFREFRAPYSFEKNNVFQWS